jgi:hypothetical protein
LLRNTPRFDTRELGFHTCEPNPTRLTQEDNTVGNIYMLYLLTPNRYLASNPAHTQNYKTQNTKHKTMDMLGRLEQVSQEPLNPLQQVAYLSLQIRNLRHVIPINHPATRRLLLAFSQSWSI